MANSTTPWYFNKWVMVGALILVLVIGISISMAFTETKPPEEELIWKYKPGWAFRTWNGRTWECPQGSVDYMRDENQCLTSEYGPRLWRPDDEGTWGWSCPNGTTPNDSNDGNKKCIVGHNKKMLIDGVWRCTDTETDTGHTWENSDWFTAQKQCKRTNSVFTHRMKIGGEWKCPPATTDTGFTWDNGGDNGGKQCQYTAW